MADGIIPGLLSWIDQKKQTAKASLGLLADNPSEWAKQTTALYLPTKEEEKQFQVAKQLGNAQAMWDSPYMQKMFNLGQIQGTFAGVNALTANKPMLEKAIKLESSGIDPRKIWQETGWFKAPDNKWRFEIDDSAAAMKRLPLNDYIQTLKGKPVIANTADVLSHQQLMEAYPWISKVPVKTGSIKSNSGAFGEFIDNANMISAPTGITGKVSKPVTLHEIQHAIQAAENFGRGGTPEFMQESMFSPKYAEQINALRNKAVNLMGGENYQAGQALKTQARNLAGEAQYDAYMRLLGEAEARAAVKRMGFTPQQRKEIFPLESYDVPVQDLIVYGVKNK